MNTKKTLSTIKFSIIIYLLIFVASSCNNRRGKSLPAVKGKSYEITVVINKKHWKALPGKLIREVFEEEVGSLPQSDGQNS